MASSNLYALLQLEPTATHEEIVTSYRRLAQIYHPDKNPGLGAEATERFQQIQQAYETLSHATTRARYDTNNPNSFHMNRVRYPDGSLGPFAFSYDPQHNIAAPERYAPFWQRDDGGLARGFAAAQAARIAQAARTDQATQAARAIQAVQRAVQAVEAIQAAQPAQQTTMPKAEDKERKAGDAASKEA
ncbi:hypothetical protein DL766_006094 [Monosporascus sp. MC13-8B]|uniref:J domain-containing protein n=1 Tax=Monosporascus cannonballus TaxID=155416 RepID=A0ABY0H7D0_9PEZI|nr:hypothetical protein DL762_004973 [Monosporascus cannonballus]RYP28025.1 hypothetical protein DL766_006094 [Monosporascus sp. MC13-8B]